MGYLPPDAMAFLVAAQAVVRRAGWRARRRLASMLEPNQAASFAACHLLARDKHGLRQRLGIAADRQPLPPPEPATPVREFPAASQDELVTSDPGSWRAGWNAGGHVFRVPRTTAVRARQALGLLAGGCAAIIARAVWGAGAWAVLALIRGRLRAGARRGPETTRIRVLGVGVAPVVRASA